MDPSANAVPRFKDEAIDMSGGRGVGGRQPGGAGTDAKLRL
jgi:hypothetical protein